MLPVQCAAEPANFDARVRQKGLSAIDELVGRPPRVPHAGKSQTKVASREVDIPGKSFPPYWRDALSDMLVAYNRRCAFLGLYLEHATGNPSVDHMLPKSRSWKQVYEWRNYRLCAASINSKKSNLVGIVDPFTCKLGWFQLDLVAFQIKRGPSAPQNMLQKIDATLKLLNTRAACKAREEYVENYRLGPGSGGIDLAYLERRAPFIALELRRQGGLLRGDQ